MKIVVTGHRGLLGRAVMRRLAPRRPAGWDRATLDLADGAAVRARFTAAAPDVVVHCAGFTQVDRAEAEPARAQRDNVDATAQLARSCAESGAHLIALSTDYVFDGRAGPYHEADAPAPTTVYGASKWAAERAVQAAGCPHTILRTAWLYGPGGPSFVHTMRRLGAGAGPPLRVVDDQRGNPTACAVVADVIAWLLDDPLPGVVHATCEGDATWYDLAVETLRLAGSARGVEPCTTAEFPRPAARPADSRLENRALSRAGWPPRPHWRDALAAFARTW